MEKKINSVRHKEELDSKKVNLVSLVSFLLGFTQATLAYILSYYFELSSGTEKIGLFYLIPNIVILVALLNFHKFVKRFGKSMVFFLAFFLNLLAIIFLSLMPPSWPGAILMIIYLIFGSLVWVGLDVILESFSVDKMSGRIRGLHLTIMNAGIMCGPFISTKILDKFGFSGIFIFNLVATSIIFVIALVGLNSVNHEFRRKVSVINLLKKVYKRKNVLRSYYISFILSFFYAAMLIYAPIYMLKLGMGWDEIGFAFSVMLVAFVILQYPVGLLADKKWGEKEMMIFSLAIIGLSCIAVFYTRSTSQYVWALVLFLTRVGAAILEIASDAYFYKRIDGTDVDVIDFFRTARPVAYIIFSAAAAVLLLFFPMESVFLLAAAVALAGLYPAIKLVDNKSEQELSKVD